MFGLKLINKKSAPDVSNTDSSIQFVIELARFLELLVKMRMLCFLGVYTETAVQKPINENKK